MPVLDFDYDEWSEISGSFLGVPMTLAALLDEEN